ncbi:MAG TPA: DinB family protein [Fimbriimonadaceae bacterium]|nr:DinB family protein [Fimbriimonadaceae bacterium]
MTQLDLIEAVRGHLDEQEEFVCSQVRGLGREALNWKAAPDGWSVAQCLDHLIRTADMYLGALDAAISAAPPRAEEAHRNTWLGGKIIAAVGPDSKANVPVPKPLIPSEAPFDESICDRFLDQIGVIRALVSRAESVDLNRAKLSSPMLKLIRFNLGDALLILGVHGLRHIRQARRVIDAPEFPASKLPV